ncbi:MAG: aspartate/glutamate racemase family protein [Deltaproteobacteria bacterium]|nr:aspartate/glutamate racemase family protein [Deltaproteobacteria bacterium]
MSVFVNAYSVHGVSHDQTKNPAIEDKLTQTFANEPSIKTIGIIGGVSWASSLEYYRLMNEIVRDTLGGVHSAQILMYSIEFGEFSKQERLAEKGDWTLITKTMVDAAQRLKRGGADFIVIASNTLNSLAGQIEETVGIPVIHIADVTGEKVREKGLQTVALLGTKYTMEQPFYQERLKKYGIKAVTPNEKERDYINTVIFDELCANNIEDESRKGFVEIINRLRNEEGAEGVILGCTEIPLLVKQKDVDIPVFDTTAIHSEAAVRYSLSKK